MARLGIGAHPVDRLITRLGHHLRVLLDLAPDEVLESREDVLAEVAGPDRVALDEADRLDGPVPGNARGGRDDHR